MLFQKPRPMGRVTGRERGGCWEVLSQCSGIRVRERTPGLSLTAESAAALEGQSGFIALLQPRSEESATCAMPRAFHLHLCCFSLATLRSASQFSVRLCTFIPQGCWGRVLHPSIQNAVILPALHSQFWTTAMAVALDFS